MMRNNVSSYGISIPLRQDAERAAPASSVNSPPAQFVALETGKYSNITNIEKHEKHRKNMRKHIVGGAIVFAAVLAVTFCQWGGSAAAQAPSVTPFPGPAATATAAAQNMAAARSQQQQGAAMKAQAEQYRARADTLETQGNDAISQGAAAYSAAASDAEQASADIKAQQIGAALELLARLQTNLNEVKGQLDIAQNSISELKSIVNVQYSTIITLTEQKQQAEMNVTTLRNAYAATVAQQDATAKQNLAGNAIALLAFVAALFVLIAWIAQVMRSRRADPPAYSVSGAEVIDAEDNER